MPHRTQVRTPPKFASHGLIGCSVGGWQGENIKQCEKLGNLAKKLKADLTALGTFWAIAPSLTGAHICFTVFWALVDQ